MVKMAQHLLSERALLSEPRLHHACVYRCYCTLRDEDNVYYVTELMPRGTAHDHVRALNARQGTNTGALVVRRGRRGVPAGREADRAHSLGCLALPSPLRLAHCCVVCCMPRLKRAIAR